MDESRSTRVTVEQAARLLGIDKQSVERRIERGELLSEEDAGDITWVYVPGRETVNGEWGHRPDTDEQLSELRRRILHLEHQLYQQQQANRENRRLISELMERLPAPETESASPLGHKGSAREHSPLTVLPPEAPARAKASGGDAEPPRWHFWLTLIAAIVILGLMLALGQAMTGVSFGG